MSLTGQINPILLCTRPMTDQTKQMALSRWICNELKDGISLTQDVLIYLDATFGTRDLPSVLADADAGEIDSLLELLFFPDTALQVRYEARWAREHFSEQDKDAVIELLCTALVEADIRLPDTGLHIFIPVPAFILRTFVERLNICWQPSARLAQAVDLNCPDEIGLKTRVQLRNARLAWHEDHISLICLFLSQMAAQSETFESDLDFLISILSEMTAGSDPFAFLIGKKFFYFQSLCKAEDYESKRLSSNMEIMMMAGARSAHGSIDQWRQSMRRIDRICQALFGRTQFFQQPDSQCIDLQNGLNMQDVVRKLS